MSVQVPTWENSNLYDYLYNDDNIPNGWEDFFNLAATKAAIKTVSEGLAGTLKTSGAILDPPLHKVFKAFELSPLDQTKVIIIGQDPAPEPGLAQGISFSIPANVSTSKVPSIQRILLEAQNEGINVDINNGDLTPWGKEGVLLLNETLTISCTAKTCTPDSNLPYWAPFTPLLIKFLNQYTSPFVYILWGQKAQSNIPSINAEKDHILKGGHPSPQADSYYFFCRKYFLDANEFLKSKGLGEINWNLSDKPKKDYGAWVWGWDSEKEKSFEESPCKGSDRDKKNEANSKDK